jgi:TonB family protein
MGQSQRITLMLNGAVAGVFEMERFGGHILFDSRKGRVELRKLTISGDPIAQSADLFSEPEATARAAMNASKQSEAAGMQSPKLTREVKPSYTPEAMDRRVQGVVRMEAVVMADGSVGPVRIAGALDPDLDLVALATVKEWKFKPGVVNGNPTPMLVEVEMTFILK